MQKKLYKVKFHGSLGDMFGKSVREVYGFHLQDVVTGLVSACGYKFKSTIMNGAWHVIVGDKKEEEGINEKDTFISKELVTFPILGDIINFYPAIEGAGGNSGALQIILGVVLIAAAVVFAQPELVMGAMEGVGVGAETAAYIAGAVSISSSVASSMALAGAASILGGIMSLLVPVPKMNYSVAARQSFIFNGVVNNVHQGVPVPIIYGEHLTGSTVISADIITSNVNYNMLTYDQAITSV